MSYVIEYQHENMNHAVLVGPYECLSDAESALENLPTPVEGAKVKWIKPVVDVSKVLNHIKRGGRS